MFVLRLLVALAIPVAAFAVLWRTFDFLRDEDANRLLVVGVAIVVGVGGVFFLYWAMNRLVEMLPERYREGVRPYVFVGPALVILGVFLVYPVINTLLISFKDSTGRQLRRAGQLQVRLHRREHAARDPQHPGVDAGRAGGRRVHRARVRDARRPPRRGEAVAKSLIFMPMAISFAGAAITWRLIYDFRPEGFGSNIGLLNGVWMGLGHAPVAWLQQDPWNNLLLMVIMVWMQTGFAMVVLSAAIKAIPAEITEAARIDGASEFQVFRRIIVPSIAPTIAVVTTYMVINALKVFDIVFVIGGAETNKTEVIAERMIRWFFILNNSGRGAAIAVVLFVAIIPIMVWNMKRFREQEMIR